MKKIDSELVKAATEGTVDKKALAIKLVAMTAATLAGVVGTVLVQRAIDRNSEESPAE